MDNIFGNPEKNKVAWKISGPWARKKINCVASAIVNGCGGCCCSRKGWDTRNKWPIMSFGDGTTCDHFVAGSGCRLSLEERPIKCILYPFILNEQKTLVLYGRALLCCKANYNTQDKSVFEIFESSFTRLFGKEQYDRVYKDIITDEKDSSIFYPSEKLVRVEADETVREKNNDKPKTWSEYE
jgi:hypothetical protein